MLVGFAKRQRYRVGCAAHRLVLVISAAMIFTAEAASQDAAALWGIHAHLQDRRGLARQRSAVVVAEIAGMESVPRVACKLGVEFRVRYRVVEDLWDEPDSPLKPGQVVSKGFVDCREKRLDSPPFAIGVKVLLYCGKKVGYSCLPPAQYTEENLHKVQAWLDDLRGQEGDSALLQVHERFLRSDELLREIPAGRPLVINGETSQPFLFIGQIKGIEPPLPRDPVPMSVAMRRRMEIAVSKVLWGEYKEATVQAWCNSPECGGAQPNEKVIMHCYATRSLAECSPPSVYSPEKKKKVEDWIAGQIRN